jgi:hypothetical protein
MSFNIDFFLNLLFHDLEFVDTLETAIREILKDGKLDHYDIPQILVIIVEVINNFDKIKFTQEELFAVVKKVFEFVVNKYNLPLDDEQRERVNVLVQSSLKLVFLQPKFSQMKMKWVSLFSSCLGEKQQQHVIEPSETEPDLSTTTE